MGDITHLESFGDHVHVHLVGQKKVTREPLYSILERLPKAFIRVHRSFAVNADPARHSPGKR